jgi:hypothetical protein
MEQFLNTKEEVKKNGVRGQEKSKKKNNTKRSTKSKKKGKSKENTKSLEICFLSVDKFYSSTIVAVGAFFLTLSIPFIQDFFEL